MTLPALPRETGNAELDVRSLFLYLQRLRDQFTDTVSTTVIENTFGAEDAQDAIGNIVQDTSTIDVTYNDATPSLQWSVLDNTSVQKIEVAKNGVLVDTRKRLNFSNLEHNQFIISSDALNDAIDITVNPFTCRYIATGETETLLDQQCLLSARYFNVQGTLVLQGDATLQVL